MKWIVDKIVTAGMILACTVSAEGQDKMSLRDAVELLLKNNQQVQIAQESVTGAELKIHESKSVYWPQVNVAGSYMRMSLFSEMDFAFGGQTYKVKFGLPNNYNMRASVMEQVFNWGRTAKTIEISKAGLDLAQDGVALTKHILSYQVVPLFYGTIFFKEALKVLDDNVKAFEKKQETMDKRYQAGLASDFDKTLIRVQISALQAQKLDFENNISKFRVTFNALAGRPDQAAFDPSGQLAIESIPFTKDELIKEALANRIEFQQVAHQLDLGRASLDLAKTGNKPTLTATFNYEFRNGYMPDMEKIRGNWTAALALSYPVFDGFRVGALVDQAQSNLKAVEMRKTDLERTVAMEIESALSDLKTIELKFEVEKLKIQQSEDALRIAEERYQSGLLSATDLVDAQNSLESARLNALQLIYNHTLSRYGLFRSCGRKI